jgi:hypothetical protein
MLCNKNCFECEWDDCINDEVTRQDTIELEEMDKWLFPEEEKIRMNRQMKNKKYYSRNKEKVLAQKREQYRQRRREKRG